jgi:hypothetical protein
MSRWYYTSATINKDIFSEMKLINYLLHGDTSDPSLEFIFCWRGPDVYN